MWSFKIKQGCIEEKLIKSWWDHPKNFDKEVDNYFKK